MAKPSKGPEWADGLSRNFFPDALWASAHTMSPPVYDSPNYKAGVNPCEGKSCVNDGPDRNERSSYRCKADMPYGLRSDVRRYGKIIR